MKLKLFDQEIELVQIRYQYLYSYLLKFSIKHHIYDGWNDGIIIPQELESEFNNVIEFALLDLLGNCYEEPKLKEKEKHSSRFEKIELKNKIYTINYRTDIVGIISFGLYGIYQLTLRSKN